MGRVRTSIALGALLAFGSGCVTRTYQSASAPKAVARCIEARWSRSGAGHWTVPVLIEEIESGYFVTPTLPRPPVGLIAGTKHPLHAVWAEVIEVPGGSRTEYHRAFQLIHARIDRAVIECQSPVSETP